MKPILISFKIKVYKSIGLQTKFDVFVKSYRCQNHLFLRQRETLYSNFKITSNHISTAKHIYFKLPRDSSTGFAHTREIKGLLIIR